MARKILFKDSGLNSTTDSPVGYKYVGYDGQTISEKSGATISAIGGGGSSLTTNNGLSLSGSELLLGGTLSQSTTINGNSTYDLNLTTIKGLNISTTGSNTSDVGLNLSHENGMSMKFNDSTYFNITNDAGGFGRSYFEWANKKVGSSGFGSGTFDKISLVAQVGTVDIGGYSTPNVVVSSFDGSYLQLRDSSDIGIFLNSKNSMNVEAEGTAPGEGHLYLAGRSKVSINGGSGQFGTSSTISPYNGPVILNRRGTNNFPEPEGLVIIKDGGRIFQTSWHQTVNSTTTDTGVLKSYYNVGLTGSFEPTNMVDGDVLSLKASVTAMNTTRTKAYSAELFSAFKKSGGTITQIGVTDLREVSDFSTVTIDTGISGTNGVIVKLSGESPDIIAWRVDYDYSITNYIND